MKNLQKFMVYMDDGHDTFKCAIPAENERKAREYVAGNGEIIAVKNITSDYPIDADKVFHALKNAEFGKIEMDLIVRTLTTTNIAE